MLNRKLTISPRVLAQDVRGKHKATPLEKAEFDTVVEALKCCGIRNALNRLMDDSVRFALDELIENI